MRGWTDNDVPELAGRTALVTGANSGLGFETARVLARRGATVILAVRNLAKGEAAVQRIRAELPAAQVSLQALDLADLGSVRRAVDALAPARLDLVIANAGLMALPEARTADGFEMQVGTNHLGHFALVVGLAPALVRTPGARVVTVSSIWHRWGRLSVEDPLGTRRRYTRWGAYADSKQANVLFMRELGRRLAAHGVVSTGAHPGYASTELQGKGASTYGGSRVEAFFMRVTNALFAQSAAAGAWPQLRAATDPEAKSGDYFGPSRLFHMRGPATLNPIARRAQDDALAAAVWAASEQATGVRLTLDAPATTTSRSA